MAIPGSSAAGAGLWAVMLAALALGADAATRKVSGTVKWTNGQPIAGAVVKLYDNDNVGKDSMGSATTTSTGAYSISYTVKDWDWCCGGSTNPDPLIEVYLNGVLLLKTGELASDVTSDRTFNLVVSGRTLSGTVFWGTTNERISGAVVKAYDNDLVGREFMGQAITNSAGFFSIVYSASQDWDGFPAVGDSRRPDPKLEVWVGGKLWLTTGEVSNLATDRYYSLALTRIQVYGKAMWQETCLPAAGLAVAARDDDLLSSELMGSTKTGADGRYSMNVNYKEEGDSSWDFCCGSETNPDVYSEFYWPASISSSYSKGKTFISNNRAVSGGTTNTLNQGTTYLWRGDAAPGAQATQTALKLDTIDWIEIEELNQCSPRKIRATIYVNYQKEGDTTNAQFSKLKALFAKGINENWSRTGIRAVTLSNGLKYDVVTQVASRSSKSKNVELEWVTSQDFKRSNNVGSVAFFDLDPIIYYNYGWSKKKYGADWQKWADYTFLDTAAHEFGHSILRAAPPPNWPQDFFESVFLTKGQSYSWTHKGTSSILQEPLASAPPYPKTGDAELMWYYNSKSSMPADFYNRTFASEDDVKRMVGVAGRKRVRLATCGC